MPTVIIIGPYRLFFYSSDAQEPIHIHVERDENIAKFWLEPLRLANSGGFNRKELNRIADIIQENKILIQEAWNDYFND